MGTMKQFRSAFIAAFAMASLFLLPGCPCPPSPNPPSCPHPDPLITFKALNSKGFSITPDTFSNATSVIIEVSGNSGSPKKTFNAQPGLATIIKLDTTYHRPLRLKFAYRSASGDTLATDELRIEDSDSHGVTIPDMDVIVGATNFTFPECPSTTQAVLVTTNNGISTFSWDAGDAFEVLLSYNGTTYKFRVHPVAGTGDDSGTTTLYKYPNHSCLSDITTQVVSSTEVALMTIANTCRIKAWNDGTNRTVTIRHPASATIVVNK